MKNGFLSETTRLLAEWKVAYDELSAIRRQMAEAVAAKNHPEIERLTTEVERLMAISERKLVAAQAALKSGKKG